MLMVFGEFSDFKKYKFSYWLFDLIILDNMMFKYFDFGYQVWEVENLDYNYIMVVV